jgi:hypothetical protein
MSSAVRPSHPFVPWWKLIDWRLVAAVGLPLWAFVFGMIVARTPAAPTPLPDAPPVVVAGPPVVVPLTVPPPEPPEPPPVEEAPPPRVVKPEPVVLTVPVIVPAVEPPPPEFKLPDAEVVAAADKCQTFGTAIRFHRGLPEATEEAKASKKLLFVLHISGHFDDPGFTWNNAQALRAGALSNGAVGRFMNEHFEATHQKAGTFKVIEGVKVGGNVAAYFCLQDGTVLHTVAGPVDAQTFLREARWAVDLRKLAATEARGDVSRYRLAVRKGHLERLAAEHGSNQPAGALPKVGGGPPPVPHAELVKLPAVRRLGRPGQVHALLATYPLARLDQVYPIVFEQVLGEKVSTLPVQTK